MLIRSAAKGDIGDLNRLLYQVAAVHHDIRPDLFKEGGKKYTDAELEGILACEDTPVFVAEEDGRVLGYAFCVIEEHAHSGAMHEFKSLYIDDLCVDESARGRHTGTALFEHVKGFAREIGCRSITLNVWTGNTNAEIFYAKMGLKPQKTTLETLL